MQKKAVKKEVKKIVQANDSVFEFLKNIENKYIEDELEKNTFSDVYRHLENMNLLFSRFGAM